MRINHNISALNTYRQLTTNNAATSKSLEKLSSGLRINRAGDDAAGLAISEKMRGQIRGLDQASRNASDGISLIQTAEGALQETHSILQRMRELSVQAANDTNTDADRMEMQKEINQLATEITRISTDTEFNTMKLLDGSFGLNIANSTGNANIKTTGDYTGNTTLSLTVDQAVAAEKEGSADVNAAATANAFDSGFSFSIGSETYTIASGTYTDVNDILAAIQTEQTTQHPNSAYTFSINTAGTGLTVTANDVGSAGNFTISGTDSTALFGTTSDTTGTDATITAGLNGGTYRAVGNEITMLTGDYTGLSFDYTGAANNDTVSFEVDNDNALTFHIGANQGQNMTALISDMSARSLGVNNLNLTQQSTADAAISTIDTATAKVSAERAKLGAIQNRLEHTINNLGTSSENLTAAESRIRDVDMAKEMMEFTKNNILSQASQAMLAQANQQPQSVLQLLQ